jgi:hypothetical protein
MLLHSTQNDIPTVPGLVVHYSNWNHNQPCSLDGCWSLVKRKRDIDSRVYVARAGSSGTCSRRVICARADRRAQNVHHPIGISSSEVRRIACRPREQDLAANNLISRCEDLSSLFIAKQDFSILADEIAQGLDEEGKCRLEVNTVRCKDDVRPGNVCGYGFSPELFQPCVTQHKKWQTS